MRASGSQRRAHGEAGPGDDRASGTDDPETEDERPALRLVASNGDAPSTVEPSAANGAPEPPSASGAPASPSAETAAETAPSAANAASSPSIRLRTLPMSAPFRWLALGWGDFVRCTPIGLFYGACFIAMGWTLLKVYENSPAWVLALSAGFLLVGPFLCLGLYQASRRLERGERPDLGDSLLAWDQRLSAMAIFGFVLLVLEMLWGRASLVVFAVSFDGMPDFKGSLTALLDPENIGFIVAYLAVGAVFAGLIFAISVVSIPMLLDQPTDAITAGLTSMRLTLTQPGVMLLWGALITALIAVAMLPMFIGLLVAAPVVGHASWHAYREAVEVVPGDSPGDGPGESESS